jgi:hypothetical protein
MNTGSGRLFNSENDLAFEFAPGLLCGLEAGKSGSQWQCRVCAGLCSAGKLYLLSVSAGLRSSAWHGANVREAEHGLARLSKHVSNVHIDEQTYPFLSDRYEDNPSTACPSCLHCNPYVSPRYPGYPLTSPLSMVSLMSRPTNSAPYK